MNDERSEELLALLKKIKDKIADKQEATKLELEKLERVIKRLDSFSTDCSSCKQHLLELENYLQQLENKLPKLEKKDYKEHRTKLYQPISHLQKEHKLVTEGQYLAIFMSLGMSIGLVFGLVLFDNLALGIPIGFGLGISIGAGLDANAKKKGMTI